MKFTFVFTITHEIELSEKQIFPDDETPERPPTLAEVRAAVAEYGSPLNVLEEWHLDRDPLTRVEPLSAEGAPTHGTSIWRVTNVSLDIREGGIQATRIQSVGEPK